MSWLDSTTCAAGAYALVIALAVALGRTEVTARRTGTADTLWPTFWFATAGVLFVMAAGRAIELDELVTEFGRSQARLAGWYRTRRGLQAALVGSVSAIWMVTVFVAVWRVPERRRRYLPTAVVVFTMACFAAIRLVSLHHADALLYNRSIAGVRVVAVVEWSLLALVTASTIWQPFARNPSPAASSAQAAVSDGPARSAPGSAASTAMNMPSGPN